jgi:hypothetical protein
MLSFRSFIEEEYGIESEYSKPGVPQHDLWKHGLPALRHKEYGTLIVGRRGDHHHELRGEGEHGHERGIYHRKEKKFYKCGKDTHMDSTDLMTARQRMEHGY